jgi:mannose-6-phosphate isomerase-like protein (cupin superfamily)
MNQVLIKAFDKNGKLIDIAQTRKIKAGRFLLKQDEAVPWHCTSGKEEIIAVLKGVATVRVANKTHHVKAGNLAYIPPESQHKIENKNKQDLEYLYFVAIL